MYEYRKQERPNISFPKESDERFIDKNTLSGISDSLTSIIKNIKLEDIILIALIIIILRSDCCDNLLVLALVYLLIG